VLAATLSGNYGVYGPPFERYQGHPRKAGSEEYRDSEKYEIQHWDPGTPGKLDALMRRVNQIRRENPALQNDWSLQFSRSTTTRSWLSRNRARTQNTDAGRGQSWTRITSIPAGSSCRWSRWG
jgi:hypothetical protein